ncbi:dethiobiotin synthetase [Salinimicrobium catena]|uniref:ATP-dependent dethiobiotin synthetase BioD n=1 Tax=Salinimicrobium catena TaxID=390640 RepID=A0A1H5JDD9_9FLAO|nr:dethiobiotin synthase [Salinimicrobium catena]SDK86745.1 dethiobiotin synthetase [Salinimicrobium catena]SEE50459.1 dethiobiotin synthetase [Salinimicrobium catena]
METYFITGIGTEVGKTIASAIVTEALEADYWKPIQAGDLDHSDTHKVKEMVSNQKTIFHPNSFALETPMSPHAAAEIDGVEIAAEKINEPKTENDLVIEGAGGLLVPINDTQTIADIIKPHHKVILVSRYYLGSINHTLLTAEALKSRGLNCIGVIFNGEKTPSSEEIILKMTGLPTLLHIDQEENFDRETVKRYAKKLREALKAES